MITGKSISIEYLTTDIYPKVEETKHISSSRHLVLLQVSFSENFIQLLNGEENNAPFRIFAIDKKRTTLTAHKTLHM